MPRRRKDDTTEGESAPPDPPDQSALTTQEMRLLQEIALQGNWQKAADALNMPRTGVRALFRKPAFRERYDSLFTSEELLITKRELEMESNDLAGVLNEAKSAEQMKHIHVTCPACSFKFVESIFIPAWNARLKAVEMLAKMTKLLQDNKKVEVGGTVNHVTVQLEGAEYLALERLNRGMSIPEHMYRKLEEWARQTNYGLPALPEARNNMLQEEKPAVVEGDYREIDSRPE